jgi:hypothetical protein
VLIFYAYNFSPYAWSLSEMEILVAVETELDSRNPESTCRMIQWPAENENK